MSQPAGRDRAFSHATLAALPVAAAVTIAAARHLPVAFAFQPNDLGIVSATIRAGYPNQQDVFWYVAALGLGAAFTWGLAHLVWAARPGPRGALAAQIAGAAVLAAQLLLPAPVGTYAAGVWLAVLGARAWRRRAQSRSFEGYDHAGTEPAAQRSRGRLAAIALGLLLLTSFQTGDVAGRPSFWGGVAAVARGHSDRQLIEDHFVFQAELGQHLFWADGWARGERPGRDFFCLYGPLYDAGIAGTWQLLGRSIASTQLYLGGLHLLGMASLIVLVLALVQNPAAALGLVALVPWANARSALPLLGMAALFAWLRSGDRRWVAASGLVLGTSLMLSQEFGIAFGAVTALAFVLHFDARALLAWGAALALPVASVLGWLAADGALAPMLRDLIGYPAYVAAGFGNTPFPPLLRALPLDPGSEAARQLLAFYALPAIALGALLVALPLATLTFLRPLASLTALRDALRAQPLRLEAALLALYALMAYRSVLSRSDVGHVLIASSAIVVLACIAIDLWISASRGPRPGLAIAWGLGILAGILAIGSVQMRHVGQLPARTAYVMHQLFGPAPTGDERTLRLVDAVQRASGPDEAVLFLPNNAALYYLTERRNPTRFALSHQMVTDAHRAEALADLRRDPPRLVIWDTRTPWLDEIGERATLGVEMYRFLHARYRIFARKDGYVIARLASPEPRP